ncbi:3'(2'),5'-bisphosphate nucleotidase CysQ [Sphingomonas lenta]|uniref:3'(2'),5'-bisphosphate nucleotidase CysQ n=1 Tax=Sphingomonas lenta TaxID=1141887 RepID=A0A2A2SGT0_9SPHN|nr:3'(2'),5'-bisphosphate nucleotidase CysQ [Sphingomonas lenta]PAX08494.1 3'(2'),5'-bisphosphate nucleotidase CysQ [Sphingomonas lenta]
MTDAELARSIAEEAGRLLLDLRRTGGLAGKALGDEGDARANALILRRLAAARRDDAVLSEESHDDQARCACPRVWIVDPLDGTREYAEGRDDWAVHVALSVDRHAAAGAVALPATDTTLVSGEPRVPHALPARPRMVVSRSRPPALATRVAEAIGAELIPMGSAGAKAMAVVRGEADLYLHAGGQHEWDNCAPVAVARAHGLHASRVDGAELVYNCPDPRLPDLLICHPELAERVIGLVRSLS